MKKIFIVFLILALFTGCFGGSGSLYWELTASNSDFILPFEAENVIDKGNGWVQFDLDENTFLFLYRKHGSGRATAVTQVK